MVILVYQDILVIVVYPDIVAIVESVAILHTLDLVVTRLPQAIQVIVGQVVTVGTPA